ncbi:hypothetical protein RJ55_01677 [Drechmeria coniospora]|nr:hypothetical protein RJ55_01677 [Drechmeria coniospora]
MARRDADVERDSLEGRSEADPLLSSDAPVGSPPEDGSDKAFRRTVIAMCVLFLFIVETSGVIIEPPKLQLMEDIICRDQYPDHLMGVDDGRCKDAEVQKTLAMVRSWSLSSEMFVPLLVQIPYGIIADKYGRRIVLFLALFGCCLQLAWVMVTLSFPDVFSIWAMLYGSITYFIGGGGQMAVAMLWTILADTLPVAERTAVFYQLYAMTLLLGVVVNPIAAMLLNVDPWIAMWLGFGGLILGTLATLLVPETVQIRQKADGSRRRSSVGDCAVPAKSRIRQAWFAAKNDMSHIWRFIFASKNVMILMAAYTLFSPVKLNISYNLLQYMTKRFGLTWSTATLYSTVINSTSVVVLLFMLPMASSLLTKRFGYDVLRRDLLLARISVLFLVVGSFSLAFAAVPWLFISSLVTTSLGVGFIALCRALLNAIVEPHTIATLNTTISTLETLVGLVGAPALGWLLGRGIELGGPWFGLPFLVTAICSAFVLVAVIAFKVPNDFARP